MSIQAVAWVLDHSTSRGVTRLVMISLANHADKETAECWPSVRSIAAEAGVGKSTVARHIEQLVALGELEIVEPGDARRSARYRLTQVSQSGTPSPRDERSVHVRAGRSVQPREGQNHHLTVIEPSIETSSLNELKQTLVEVFGEPTKANWPLYNRIATWIRDRGGTPADIRLRASRIAEEWGRKAVTPAALEKHWTRYDAEIGGISDNDVEKYQSEIRRAQRERTAAQLDGKGLPG